MIACDKHDPIARLDCPLCETTPSGIRAADHRTIGALTGQQRQAIAATVRQDPDARLLGRDARGRPVITAETGIVRRRSTWALMRNGDPADAAEITDRWEEDR